MDLGLALGLDNRTINICNETVVTSQSMINKLGMDSGECTTRMSIHFWSLWPSMMILCPDSVCLVEVKQISPDVISLRQPHDTGCFGFLVFRERTNIFISMNIQGVPNKLPFILEGIIIS